MLDRAKELSQVPEQCASDQFHHIKLIKIVGCNLLLNPTK